MAQFRMKIAGAVGAISACFESTPQYFLPYLTEEAPHFSYTVTARDMAFEQNFLYEEALSEGFRVRHFTDPYLERAAIQRAFCEHLFHADTLLFHGSAVAVDGKAYLFTAKSGTGKSTHTRLWREAFGTRAQMINDDKPFLQITDGGVFACGAPWSGKHGLDSNITAPLAGICILVRGQENRIQPIAAGEALPMLRRQSNPPINPALLPRFEMLVHTLSRRLPLWHMACTRDAEAALVSYRAMGKESAYKVSPFPEKTPLL